MPSFIKRSIAEPIREEVSTNERWESRESGLLWCWERGRQKREEESVLAEAAGRGELITLPWEGGVEKKLKMKQKPGSLYYLATWQGLRGEDLNISLEDDFAITCTRTRQVVVFTPNWQQVSEQE